MSKIGIFYGSDTGKTETVAEKIQDLIGRESAVLHNWSETEPETLLGYEYILLGAPTWYDGELQSDWEQVLPKLSQLDLSGKKLAIFGLGDQYGYAEFFVDAIGTIRDALAQSGAAFYGKWKNEGYDHTASKGERDGWFLGLALDDDNQSELTDSRLSVWVAQVLEEFGLEVGVGIG